MRLRLPFRKPKATWLRKLVSKMSSRKQVKGEYIETVRISIPRSIELNEQKLI